MSLLMTTVWMKRRHREVKRAAIATWGTFPAPCIPCPKWLFRAVSSPPSSPSVHGS
ncbi:MAG: hypothetical protein QXH42_09985 [Thermoplasmata archaeon]